MDKLINHLKTQFQIHYDRTGLTKQDFTDRVYTEWEMDKFRAVNAGMALVYGEILEKLERNLNDEQNKKTTYNAECGAKTIGTFMPLL